MKNDYPKKGDVYWVRLDPTEGNEIKKTRPCLIVSNDQINQSELILVAPITSKVEKIYSRLEVKLMIKDRLAKVVLRQIRCIDKTKRLGKKIGKISQEELQLVDEVLRTILSL